MIAFAIETRPLGSREWMTLTPASMGIDEDSLPGPACLGFETKRDAQDYIDEHMPHGWEAQILVVKYDMATAVHHGPKH